MSDRWVLTAARCVEDTSFQYSVSVGSILNSGQGGVLYQVDRIIPHEFYGNNVNDIALLRTSTNINFNANVLAISFASQLPPVGSEILFSGWGLTTNGGEVSPVLKYFTSQLLSDSICGQRTGVIHPGTICIFQSVGTGACNGDNGGPAVFDGQLVGIGNFVVGGCAAGNPDGIASIVFYREWIDSKIAENSN